MSLAHKSHDLIAIGQIAYRHPFLNFSGDAAKQIDQVGVLDGREAFSFYFPVVDMKGSFESLDWRVENMQIHCHELVYPDS